MTVAELIEVLKRHSLDLDVRISVAWPSGEAESDRRDCLSILSDISGQLNIRGWMSREKDTR